MKPFVDGSSAPDEMTSTADQLNCCAQLMDAVEGLPAGRSLTIKRGPDGEISVDGPWAQARNLDLAIRLGRRAK